MESENAVPLEDEKRVVLENCNNGEGSNLDTINKENNISNSKDVIKDKDGLNSSGQEPELSAAGKSKSKSSNQGKNPRKKLGKNQSDSKGSVVFGRSTKPSLSQSLSFPARGRHSDVAMKRTIEVDPVKATDKKQSQKDGALVKDESKVSNHGNGAGKAAVRRATLASLPSLRKSAVKLSV